MAPSATRAKVEAIIAEHPVAVFSKSYCPYCRAAKSLLSQHGAKGVHVLELDQIEDGDEIQATLADITHQSTVPNIFINHKHVGGNSDLQARVSGGRLDRELKEAGAL